MKNIFITGTSSGIGLGLAQHYLAEGYRVVGLSRRDDRIHHEHYEHLVFDLSNLDEISKLTSSFQAFDSFEKVILNAGILGKIDDLKHQSLESLRHIMDVNVWSNKILLDVLFSLDLPVQQVIGISSGSAYKASRGWGPYSISKAALNTLIKSISHEYPETHFCAMAPGLVDTEIQEDIRSLQQDEKFPSIALLQNAAGTPSMPTGTKAAPMLAKAFDKALEHPSGSYLDVREM